MATKKPQRPLPPFTPQLMRLAADLLDKAGDRFSNHGCNDYVLSDEFSDADAVALELATHVWNGDPEEARENPGRYQYDWILMRFLADMLRAEAGEAPPIDVEAVRRRESAEELRKAKDAVARVEYEAQRLESVKADARARLEKAKEGLIW